jgi:hypothetical protein
LKTTRDYVNIIDAYNEFVSYRGAAELCGTTDKTVKRALERQQAGGPWARRPRLQARNTDPVLTVIAHKVKDSDGRITAKRPLPLVKAAGYEGSARNLRRAVATIKKEQRQKRRIYRPWVPVPGQYLVIDWTPEAGMHIFWCGPGPEPLPLGALRRQRDAGDDAGAARRVLRRARSGASRGPQRPYGLLEERCRRQRGGSAFRLRPLRRALGFRPDFCEGGDPESKGVVEHLAGYVQTDLVVPAGGFGGKVDAANRQARIWGVEVNGRVHSETQAAPAQRLLGERPRMRPLPSLRPPLSRGEQRTVDRLQTIRIGSARYSVPTRWVGDKLEVVVQDGEIVIGLDGNEIARHRAQPPGGHSICDEH